MEFFTIGVYRSTDEDFFKKLTDNHIDTFCDVRQRRGVRGGEYSFVNSRYLQQKLHDLGIRYYHIFDLAPTTEIRKIQQQEDLQLGEKKRDRKKIGKLFMTAYKDKILGNFKFDDFMKQLEDAGANHIVLFCLEEHSEACHRSIVAEKLEQMGYKVTHL
jgi:uncharacterized protein (DUF488 family)